MGDEVRIKVAGVQLEERKIDFELVRQLTHAGRAVRSRAPRVAQVREENHGARNKDDSGEQPVRKNAIKAVNLALIPRSQEKSAEKASVSKEAPKKNQRIRSAGPMPNHGRIKSSLFW